VQDHFTRVLMFTGSLPVHRFRRLQHTLKKEKTKKYDLIFLPENVGNITPNFRHLKAPLQGDGQ
jgi:hypothetical protein